MPSNLQLLVLTLAGYLFVHFYDYLHYRAKALEGHRLIIEASIAGLTLFTFFRLVILAAKWLDSRLLDSWCQGAWFRIAGGTQYSGTLLVTMIVAIPLALIGNLFYAYRHRELMPKDLEWTSKPWWRRYGDLSKLIALDDAVNRSGNVLLVMLHKAAQLWERDFTMLAVTMNDRKLYVGWVLQAVKLTPHETHFGLFPLMSGYRDDKLRPRFNFFYKLDTASLEDPYRQLVILPLSAVSSARLLAKDFDPSELSAPEPDAETQPALDFGPADAEAVPPPQETPAPAPLLRAIPAESPAVSQATISSKSARVSGFRAIPAAIAGAMRRLLWKRTKS